MEPTLHIVDAFTDRPFSGNPAAVCLLSSAAPTAWMQAVAAEINLSETCFPLPRQDGDWDLRWFTPRCEVDLCGHATLAAARVLLDAGLAGLPLCFHTRSGPLGVASAEGGRLELDLPRFELAPLHPDERLYEAIGAMPLALRTVPDYGWLVELPDAGLLRDLMVDHRLVAQLPPGLLLLTAAGDQPGVDCVSRCFAPRKGIDEDPVTGSAHCAIGPYWAQRLGRPTLTAFQASQRGGTLHLRVEDQRVRIAGDTVAVLQGRLRVAPPSAGSPA